MRTRGAGLAVVVALVAAALFAVAPSPARAATPGACTGTQLCVGAAEVDVAPQARFVQGVVEHRLLVAPHRQRFNLGGFGINPVQGLPDADGSLGAALTTPARRSVYVGSHGPEPISVRAMVLRQPRGPSIALLTLDATGAGNVIQDHLTTAVAEATGIPKANVLFGQTHTHAGPDLQGLWGGVPQGWIDQQLYPGAVRAAVSALRTSRPARLDVRSGLLDDFNSYRRPKPAPTSDTDRRSTLVQARAVDDGHVIATLLQYDAHPTSIDERVRIPHPDYVRGLEDWLEGHGGGVALYFNGPIADASPSGTRPGCSPGTDGAYGVVRCRGEGIAAATLAFPPSRPLAPTIAVRHQQVVLPVTNPLFLGAGAIGSFERYYDFEPLGLRDLPTVGPAIGQVLDQLPQTTLTATTNLSRVTIGGPQGLELVTIPGEATGSFGTWIRSLADPRSHVVLLGLTEDSLGYFLPEGEFHYVDPSGATGFLLPFTGYEEFVSLGPLTVPLLRAEGYAPLFGADPVTALHPPHH
jgi:hypothetical protein